MKLELLQKLVIELNKSNSTLEKTAVLSKPEYNDDFIKEVLKATHNPYKQYYVTSKNLNKRAYLLAPSSNFDNLLDLLDALSSRKITGHDAISTVNAFVKEHIEYKEILFNIFDRNLKTRTGDKIINKVFPNLIPTFDVALANKFDEKTSKKVNFNDGWFASRKLDGLRCICVVDENGIVRFYSRSGKEFLTLDVVKESIERQNFRSVVFDGEICIVDEDGNEDFQSILKEYNKKDHTIINPRYKIFDFIKLEDFYSKSSTQILSERITALKNNVKENQYISFVPQWPVDSIETLTELLKIADDSGWEGLMIRKDCQYEGKRSNNLLKCKKFHDAEYIVKDIDIGPFRVIVDGLEVTEDMVRNILIEHKGYPVSVGSGFSIEQRRHFRDNPNDIIGKEVTVQYFEETEDQHGNISLRFPVLKAIYKNGRNV